MMSEASTSDDFYSQLASLWSKIAKPQRWIFGDVEKSEYADTV
ncbi:MAG: hypothetical protein WCL18_06545 [bacterium]